MVFNTITVGAAVTPEIIGTSISHYINRKPRRHKPTAHISYDLGLHLVRRFVNYSSTHTVEEIQGFTGQWVPAPTWIRTKDVEIPARLLKDSAQYLQSQLGPDGIEQVGGTEWWQWRREGKPMRAEWVEMKRDYNARKAAGAKESRVVLYIHGGAYYFGSPDEHRYQVVRHARKLKARALVPRYRLAPQFPFPCALQDCLAAYLLLLEEHEPSSILFMGDSAGGGMILSLLCILRDRGLQLPAGAILISPWCDLMHSFPSVASGGELDYIPSHGFIHRPSASWPPPTLEAKQSTAMSDNTSAAPGDKGYEITPAHTKTPKSVRTSVPSINIDGKVIEIRDQIQMYAPNHLLTYPLVSPVLQPSLGGLCPLLIQTGGGEMLRDEQIYVAHKAANPSAYPPSEEILKHYDPEGVQLTKWRPTYVQLQLWEDMCHVAHTFSWTQPAKRMYRSCSQFGAWALSRAQNRSIDIEEEVETDDEMTESELDEESVKQDDATPRGRKLASPSPLDNPVSTGRAGDPLPPFKNHMIRQRIDRHGRIYPLAPATDLAACQLPPSEIGVLKQGPVQKWLTRQREWNSKFMNERKKLDKARAKAVAKGYIGFGAGEVPPPSALAGRRTERMQAEKEVKKSWGMMMWSSWGSKHDKEIAEESTETKHVLVSSGPDALIAGAVNATERARASSKSKSRSRAYSHVVSDKGQAGIPGDKKMESREPNGTSLGPMEIPSAPVVVGDATVVPPSDSTTTRPTYEGIAYPFKLAIPGHLRTKSLNPSMVTLDSAEVSLHEASPTKDEGGHTEPSLDRPITLVEQTAFSPMTPADNDATTDVPSSRPPIDRFVTAAEKLRA